MSQNVGSHKVQEIKDLHRGHRWVLISRQAKILNGNLRSERDWSRFPATPRTGEGIRKKSRPPAFVRVTGMVYWARWTPVTCALVFVLSVHVHGLQLNIGARQPSAPPSRPSCVDAPTTTTIHATRRAQKQSRRRILSFAAAAALELPILLLPRASLAGIDVSGLKIEGSSSAPPVSSQKEPTKGSAGGSSNRNIELAGITFTPAAMLLQLAEQVRFPLSFPPAGHLLFKPSREHEPT